MKLHNYENIPAEVLEYKKGSEPMFRWWIEKPVVGDYGVESVVKCDYLKAEIGNDTYGTKKTYFFFGKSELLRVIPEETRKNRFALPRALGKVARQRDEVCQDVVNFAKAKAKQLASQHVWSLTQATLDALEIDGQFFSRLRLMAKLEAVLELYRQPKSFEESLELGNQPLTWVHAG